MSNATCSNTLFSCPTIGGMTEKPRHASIERLLTAAEQRGIIGPAALADAIGESDQTVTNWGTRGVSKSGAIKVQERIGISASWITAGEGSAFTASPSTAPQPINLESNPQYPSVRRVHFKLSAGASGFGVEYHDEEGAPIVFRRDWFERNGYRPDRLFAVRVANGSMESGLYDGDVVVVNTDQTELKDGIVFAVNYEGEMVIKRLVRDGGQWWLSSDNPNQHKYPRKVCGEGVFIIGEVVHKQSERI